MAACGRVLRAANVLIGGAELDGRIALRNVTGGSIDGGEVKRPPTEELGCTRHHLDNDGIGLALNPHGHAHADGVAQVVRALRNAVNLLHGEAVAIQRARWIRRFAEHVPHVVVQGALEHVSVGRALLLRVGALADRGCLRVVVIGRRGSQWGGVVVVYNIIVYYCWVVGIDAF